MNGIILLLGLIIFFLPTIIAWRTKHDKLKTIVIFNFLFWPISFVVLLSPRSNKLVPNAGDADIAVCPTCGTPFRWSDYRDEVKRIYCSNCKQEIPRIADQKKLSTTMNRPRPENMLPEEIQCPECGANLTLTEAERTERKFKCSACQETFSVKD